MEEGEPAGQNPLKMVPWTPPEVQTQQCSDPRPAAATRVPEGSWAGVPGGRRAVALIRKSRRRRGAYTCLFVSGCSRCPFADTLFIKPLRLRDSSCYGSLQHSGCRSQKQGRILRVLLYAHASARLYSIPREAREVLGSANRARALRESRGPNVDCVSQRRQRCLAANVRERST